MTVRKNGTLHAVLPMMLEATWRHGVPLRRLATMGNDHTPCFDLIRAGNDEDLYRSIWNHLMSLRGEWDVLDFSRLSAGSVSTESMVRLAARHHIHYSLWTKAPRSPWVHIQRSWDDYLHSRGSGFRKSLRRKLRQLNALGRVVGLETVTGRQTLSQGLADGLKIEADGWKGSNKTAISSQKEVSGFYTELAEIMSVRGQLRLHFLTLDKERIAFDYSILANRCLYSLKAGHCRAYNRFSPGTLLLALILRNAHEEQLVGMDLLGDADPFKMHWTDTTRTHQWLHCYSDSLRGRFWQTIKCRISPALRGAWSRVRADQRLA